MSNIEEHARENNPGMKCPQCGAFIETTISQLLTAQVLECPNCHLCLTINHQMSKSAFEVLRKLQEAQKNLEEKSKFNG